MRYLVYGNRRSGSCMVEMALAEIGVDYEVHDVDLGRDAQRSDHFAAINPARKLPVLVAPGGEVLTESLAIALTLDQWHPAARLLPPPDDAGRGHALRWLCFLACEIYPLVEFSDYPERLAGAGDAQAVRDNARRLWRQRWSLVNEAASATPWFLPGGFSMIDLVIAVTCRWTRQDHWRRTLPAVEGIVAAVAARPSCGAVYARHFG